MSAHPSEDRLIDLAAGLVAGSAAEPDFAHVRGCRTCEDRFKAICASLERSRLAPAAAPRRTVVWVAIGLAAAVVAALVLAPLLRTSKPPGPEAYWLPVDRDAVALRAGRPTADDAVYVEATDAYRAHDAARVVALLRGRTISDGQDPLKLVYASAALHAGDPAAALATLDALEIASLPQPYRDRAQWVELGALVALRREDEARRLADELAARPGEFSEAAKQWRDR